MIPKVIHFCWFGRNPLPEFAKKCLDSWKYFCPDYEIKLWDESNFDVTSSIYVSEAYEEKKWAFVSDYARLKIIFENGGIYLDTDVEVLRSLDKLLYHKCFLGTEINEEGVLINTGLGFGAEKGKRVIKKMLEEYEGIHFKFSHGVIDSTTCPVRNTIALKKLGYKYNNKVTTVDEAIVFPPEYFSPMNYLTGITNVTENSFSIHHYSALWLTNEDREMMKKIDNLNEIYPPIISQPIKQWMLYKKTKEKGKTSSFIGYVLEKVKLKNNNKR